jgi:thiol-disulfide isomerase/thioredoxin
MSRASYGQQVFPEALTHADEALRHVERGTSIEAAVRRQRALALLAEGSSGKSVNPMVADDPRAREAEQEFLRAAALDPRWAAPSYERGVALLTTYRDDDGVRELTRYVSTGNGEASKISLARRLIVAPHEARDRFNAPDFSLTASNGEVYSRTSLRNHVVLLDFWGSWCLPCLANAPDLRRLHQKYGNQMVTIGVGISERDPDIWGATAAKHQLDWPQYRDGEGDESGPVAAAFGVHSAPTYIVLDREGRVRARLHAWGDEGPVALEASIDRAIAIPAARP